MSDVDATEEWRTIPSRSDHQASSRGRIRNALTLKILKIALDWKQRPSVQIRLSDGRYTRCRVHQLVAEAFHGPRPPGLLTRHLNDDRHDNRPENLAYGTKFDNWQDAVRNGVPGMGVRQETCALGHAHVHPNRTPNQTCVSCDRARHAIKGKCAFGRLSSDLQTVADWYYAELMGLPGAPPRPPRPPRTRRKVNPT